MADQLHPAAYDAALTVLRRKAAGAGFAAPNVSGVSVGGCATAIGSDRIGAFRRKAHAHNHAGDPMNGWLCFLSGKTERLISPSGQPTALFAHEYAHLMAPSGGHGERWRRAVTALGHPAQAKGYRRG